MSKRQGCFFSSHIFDRKSSLRLEPSLNTLHYFKDDPEAMKRVPTLAQKLDPMIKYPGIYRLEDLRQSFGEEYYNFFKKLPQPHEVDFDQIPPYVPPSLDPKLAALAKTHRARFTMSTSTISSVLSQIYYVLSHFKESNYFSLDAFSESDKAKFMSSQKKGTTSFLRCVDPAEDLWALDSDSGLFVYNHQILLDMGRVIEKMCAMEMDRFTKLFVKGHQRLDEVTPLEADYHRLLSVNNEILLRSQIDCQGCDAQGAPLVFELKSRAAAPIRYLVTEYYKFLDYRVEGIYGALNSYERELWDLIRGAFLKYYFQLKIGNMNGAMVVYHSTFETFGFEYFPFADIAQVMFGHMQRADAVFVLGSKVLSFALSKVIEALRGQRFAFIKLGVLGHVEGKLVLLAELINDYEYADYVRIKNVYSAEMSSVKDFYAKQRDSLRVYKYELRVQPYLNGVPHQLFMHDFTGRETVELEFEFNDLGLVSFEEYMQFLFNSYKLDGAFPEQTYSAYWGYEDAGYCF